MKLLHINVVWLLIFFNLSPAVAQQSYCIQHYTTENGMPANGIKGIELDTENGFLWIGTESGIVRFDGQQLKLYNKESVSFPMSERISNIFKNYRGQIYFRDAVGNIFTVNKNELVYKDFIDNNSQRDYKKLIGLWASDSLFEQSRWTNQTEANDFAPNLVPVSDNSLLFTEGGYIFSYIKGRNEAFKIKTVQPQSKIFKWQNTIFIYEGNYRFYKLEEYYPASVPIPVIGNYPENDEPKKTVEKFFWQSGNEYPVLIAGKNAWKISFSKDHFLYTLICNEVPTNAQISAVQYWDEKGILILSTTSNGIFIIKKKTIIPVKNPLEDINQNHSFYSQIVVGPASIVTNTGDLLSGEKPARITNQFKSNFKNYTYRDGDSLLWFQRFDSLFKFYLKSNKEEFVLNNGSFSLNGIIRIGNKLFFANHIGLGYIQNNQIQYLHRFPLPESEAYTPTGIASLSPGVFAIATCNGLFRFNVGTTKLDTLLKIPNICIRALFVYKDYLLISTYGKGIFVMKNNIVKPIPIDKNRYLLYAHCFMPDAYGFCWISTNKGLFKASLPDLINAYETGNQQVYYHYFGKQDGMDITELNGGCYPCAVELASGQLSFPSMDGLIWVNPALPVTNLPDGKIFIDGVALDGNNVKPDSTGSITVPGGTRELFISLAYSAWGNGENVDIQYQLSTQPDKWVSIAPSDNGKIRINQLSSGNYELRIRMLSGFGINNYTKTTLRLSVKAPWYLHWWFILLSLLGITGLIMGIFRLRVNQYKVREKKLERQVSKKTEELNKKNIELQERDSIKTRLISIISHDIVTPLRFLHMAGKNLKENKKEMPEELQAETIDEITSTSKELELLTTNILNWIKYHHEDGRLIKERIDLHELVAQVLRSLHALAKQKNIVFVNEILPGSNIYQYIDPLKIVIYNLVLNAINFMEKGQIIISSHEKADRMHLKIKDEGVGMTQQQINSIMNNQFIITSANVEQRKGNGLGYLIIKDLLKIMGATIQIQSEKNAGTTASIDIPFEKISIT